MKQAMLGKAVALAGPYANHLHLVPDSNHASTSSINFYRLDAFPRAQPTVSKHYKSTTE